MGNKLKKKVEDQAPTSLGGEALTAPAPMAGNAAELQKLGAAELCILSDGGEGGFLNFGNHSWLNLVAEQGRMGIGLWPEDHPAIVADERSRSETDVQLNFPGDLREAESYCEPLETEQIAELFAAIDEPRKWDAYHNCADFAAETFERITGTEIDAHDEWLAGVPTPRELEANILHKNNKRGEK